MTNADFGEVISREVIKNLKLGKRYLLLGNGKVREIGRDERIPGSHFEFHTEYSNLPLKISRLEFSPKFTGNIYLYDNDNQDEKMWWWYVVTPHKTRRFIGICAVAEDPKKSGVRLHYFDDGSTEFADSGIVGKGVEHVRDQMIKKGFPLERDIPPKIDFAASWQTFLTYLLLGTPPKNTLDLLTPKATVITSP